MKYSDYFIDSLLEEGYTHCFFVGGGNILHLLESARTRLECIAVINEVTAGIAAEYFNIAMRGTGKRSFVLVTAGPGLTNMVTSISGAWLESRELLVIGGQARSNSLARGNVRQLGHQEIDGVAIAKSITKTTKLLDHQISRLELQALARTSFSGRKGPVFIEVCLDITAQETEDFGVETNLFQATKELLDSDFDLILQLLIKSERPLFLVGAGVEFTTFQTLKEAIKELGIPIATTWNSSDYLDYDDPIYAGRPNTYGMRWANAVIQQSDLLIVIGTRLSFWETGFNYDSFVPNGKIVHIDIDEKELNKDHLKVDLKICADSNSAFSKIINGLNIQMKSKYKEWIDFISRLRDLLPINEAENEMGSGYLNPFSVIEIISRKCGPDDKIVVCSSGGTYTAVMQSFQQKTGQLLTNNKGLASMGYGLAGAIGTAIALPEFRTLLFEGDGGFAQNIGDLGTLSLRQLNLKIFLFSNEGFASIRISQKTNFKGNYIGCDADTGIGLPNWSNLFSAFNIPNLEITSTSSFNEEFKSLFDSPGPAAFILNIDKEQAFFPKLASSTLPNGQIVSNPLHLMSPEINPNLVEEVFPYLDSKYKSINNYKEIE
jgi:acetolactate synthase-1/2/3 large subunit